MLLAEILELPFILKKTATKDFEAIGQEHLESCNYKIVGY